MILSIKKTRILAVCNAITLFVHISFSYFTQLKLVNTKDVAQVSNDYPSLFTPAGLTFTIWGLIYIALIVFCVYHLIMAWSRNALHPANNSLRRIGGWFSINNIATAAWLVLWTNEKLLWATAMIVVQLTALIIINLRLGIYSRKQTTGSKLFTQFPMGIYFAWITIAAIANISIYLRSIGWNGFGIDDVTWTNTMIGAAVLITVLVINIRRNIFFGPVVIWALYGIILKRTAEDASLYFSINRTAWIGISVIGFIIILQLIRNKTSSINWEEPFPITPNPLK